MIESFDQNQNKPGITSVVTCECLMCDGCAWVPWSPLVSPGLPGRPLCLRFINPCPVYPTPGPHTTLLAFLSCSRFASTNQRPFLCPGNQSKAWRVWSPHTRSLGICRLDNNRPVTTSSWFTKCNSVVVRTLHIKIDGSKMIHLCSLEFKYMPQV